MTSVGLGNQITGTLSDTASANTSGAGLGTETAGTLSGTATATGMRPQVPGTHDTGATSPPHAPPPKGHIPKLPPTPAQNVAAGKPVQSAKALIQELLDTYGLGQLTNWAWNTYTANGGGQTGTAAITAELPQTKEFQARFPAYQQLAKEGRAMSVQSMLDYETRARQVFQANGMPKGFYDTPDQLAKFMLNDVSTAELETRVKDAQTVALQSPPDVRAQLHTMFGVDAGHLTAYFLDPSVAEPILQQRANAAQLGAESARAGVGQLSAEQGMHLSQLGITAAAGGAGFETLGKQQGLFQAQTQGEGQIGLDTQLAAQFGNDAQAQLEFQRRAAARKAAFQAQSGFSTQATGVAALAPTQRAV